MERVRIETFARKKQRAELSEMILSKQFATWVLTLDRSKHGRGGEEARDIVFGNNSPECACVGRPDRFPFEQHGRATVDQRSVYRIRMSDGPTDVRSGPEDFSGLN